MSRPRQYAKAAKLKRQVPEQDDTDALTAQAAEIEALKAQLAHQAKSWGREREIDEETIEALRADAERLTNERAVFGRWMSEALLSLGTMSEDEMEDGGDYHRMFMDRGRRLADAAMQSGKAVTP